MMYGSTEATARMSYLSHEYATTKTGSIGKPIEGGQFIISDSLGRPITDSNISGSLVYRGENVTLGYATSYRNLSDGDNNNGSLHTGDIATRDDEGFYYIVGRESRFVKIYGHRLNLDELEEIIKDIGYDCACVGSDDDITIYITERTNTDLKKIITSTTGLNHRCMTIQPIIKIPRTENGKIDYLSLNVTPSNSN